MAQDALNIFLNKPKADVHNHFHLGGSKQRFLALYNPPNFVFPSKYEGLPGMIDFIYQDLNRYLRTEQDVINFMRISIESSIDDNITYLEASVDINLARFFGGSIQRVIEETKNLVEEFKDRIDFRPEIGVNKDLDLDTAYNHTQACFDSGVFHSIDLYGAEANQDLYPFVNLYKEAARNGLKTKVHIGEFSDAQSISEAIEILNPDEIQHGISAIDDNDVIDMILERDIRLNICPESNIMLGRIQNLKAHPVRALFDKGVNITINTDDLILFHKTNSQQLQELHDLGIFSLEELDSIRSNGFNQ
ncbi:MAG: hypothetical protein CMB99_06910 [Flavobacteriaceae bacterium]|nr:hypothetical protein [Flavobacteriaceae bacterium]|tara:strand:+ start:48837 stop:49751 length:915 start_codon:yes stop_codon:yes gene_type:complete